MINFFGGIDLKLATKYLIALFIVAMASCFVGRCFAVVFIPLGQTGIVDNWQVKVVTVFPDATQAVLKENMLNTKPKPGEQYFMVAIEAKNLGDAEYSFYSDNLHLVGDSLVAYDTAWCVPPNKISSNDAFPGGTLKGNVAFLVPSSEVNSLKMYYEPGFSKDKTYFALS